MKEFFRWVVEGESVLSQKLMAVLEAKIRGRKVAKFGSMFEVTSPPLLWETKSRCASFCGLRRPRIRIRLLIRVCESGFSVYPER